MTIVHYSFSLLVLYLELGLKKSVVDKLFVIFTNVLLDMMKVFVFNFLLAYQVICGMLSTNISPGN